MSCLKISLLCEECIQTSVFTGPWHRLCTAGGFETLCRIWGACRALVHSKPMGTSIKMEMMLLLRVGGEGRCVTQTSGLCLIPTRSPLKKGRKKIKNLPLAESCDELRAKYCGWQGRVRQCCGCQAIGRVEKWHGDDRPLRRPRKGFKVFLQLMSLLYEGMRQRGCPAWK